MVDKPQAQKNGLGELFVDIGVHGLGTTLKSLNSVAASFLLGKNAANQFVQTISQPFKQAGNSAVEIGKMSTALSTTREEYQKLVQYIKNNGLDESLIGDIAKLQQAFKDAPFKNLPQEMMWGLQRLGIEPQKYVNEQGTFQSILKLIDEMDAKSKNLSLENRNQILRWMGMSSDWGYLWDEGKKISDYYTVSTTNLKANEDLAKSMSEFSTTLNNFKDNVLANLAPTITEFIRSMTDWIKIFNPDAVGEGVKGMTTGALPQNGFTRAITTIPAIGLPNSAAGAVRGYLNTKKTSNYDNMPPKEFPTGMAASITPESLQGTGIPTNFANGIQNNTNNLYQDITINGDNAREIGQEVAKRTKQDIEYLQFQATNLPVH